MSTLVLPAPAKLNLFLHITGRREDGYHLLQTVFQFIDLADEITCVVNPSGEIRRLSALEGVAPGDDLVVKAARLLKEKMQLDLGVDIFVEKKLPMGGGLGGGSSDAATVLHACNQLWECQQTDAQLAEIGLQLGADVPVFVHGFSAWAEGIGEELTPILPPESWYVVISPNVTLSTAEIFSREGLTRDCDAIKMAAFLQGQGCNVFEAEARKMSSDISQALDWLNQFAPSRLTGSGSCLFAPFESRNRALEVVDQIPPQWRGFVAKGMNQSSLKIALQH